MNEDAPYDKDVDTYYDVTKSIYSEDMSPVYGSPTEYKETEPVLVDDSDSQFVRFTQNELFLAGLFDQDSDYGGMIGKAVMELVEVFSKQGHSGFSAQIVAHIFYDLTKWKPLSPLTNNPKEWNDVGYGMWQSSRSPSSFSDDEGKTYYNLDDEPRVIYTSEEAK